MVGQYVRLWGFDPSELPPTTATAEELRPLLQAILNEALPFINDLPQPQGSQPSKETAPNSSWNYKTTKSFSNSTGAVELYDQTVTANTSGPSSTDQGAATSGKSQSDYWALRRSIHENANKPGTARWEDFVRDFKQEHAESEKQFTPAVLENHLLHQWDCSGVEEIQGSDGQVWHELTLKHEESVHKLPAPLKKRVFPVLQVTASVRGKREFLVVQIAVRDDEAETRRGRDVVRGAYSSVERARELEDGAKVEWVMGTVSDARGVLPGWMQKMAVPGAVAKDVDMYMTWINQKRSKEATT